MYQILSSFVHCCVHNITSLDLDMDRCSISTSWKGQGHGHVSRRALLKCRNVSKTKGRKENQPCFYREWDGRILLPSESSVLFNFSMMNLLELCEQTE